MKRWIGLSLVILAALILAPTATARPKLTKANARLEAEIAAYDHFSRTAATSLRIGRCLRKSRYRVLCFGRASGDEFLGCSSTTFQCSYRHVDCTFRAPVHQAGYSAIARITAVRCSSYDYVQ